MDVFTQSTLIVGTNDDGDLPSLVEGARSGRPAAVERLVARVQDRVRGWAARFTEDADAADDVAQEVLIGLERRVRKFSGTSRFSTWLFSVTRNVALSRRRREQHRAFLLERRTAADPPQTETIEADPDAVNIARLALRYFEELPAKQRLQQCIATIDEGGVGARARDGTSDRSRAPVQSASDDPVENAGAS